MSKLLYGVLKQHEGGGDLGSHPFVPIIIISENFVGPILYSGKLLREITFADQSISRNIKSYKWM